MEMAGLGKGGDRVALLSSAETIPAPPGPAHSRSPGAPCSHRAILEPVLEVLAPRLGPAHILAALGGDPLDQDLLQVCIVLFLDLLLYLPAQAVGRSPVGHSEGWRQWLSGAGERTRPDLRSAFCSRWSGAPCPGDTHRIPQVGPRGENSCQRRASPLGPCGFSRPYDWTCLLY